MIGFWCVLEVELTGFVDGWDVGNKEWEELYGVGVFWDDVSFGC